MGGRIKGRERLSGFIIFAPFLEPFFCSLSLLPSPSRDSFNLTYLAGPFSHFLLELKLNLSHFSHFGFHLEASSFKPNIPDQGS